MWFLVLFFITLITFQLYFIKQHVFVSRFIDVLLRIFFLRFFDRCFFGVAGRVFAEEGTFDAAGKRWWSESRLNQ